MSNIMGRLWKGKMIISVMVNILESTWTDWALLLFWFKVTKFNLLRKYSQRCSNQLNSSPWLESYYGTIFMKNDFYGNAWSILISINSSNFIPGVSTNWISFLEKINQNFYMIPISSIHLSQTKFYSILRW